MREIALRNPVLSLHRETEQQSYFVQTNPEVGITKEDSEKAINILKR